MAAPVIDSITFDRNPATYPVGTLVTVLMKVHDPDARSYTFTGTATDAEGNATPATATFNISDALTVAGKDDGNHTWTLVSFDGTTAKLTTTA